MLLQTFVQLNILLLAGWAALPVGHPLLAQVVHVVSLSPATQALAITPRAAFARADTAVLPTRSPVRLPASCPFSETLRACIAPFPHAARAP